VSVIPEDYTIQNRITNLALPNFTLLAGLLEDLISFSTPDGVTGVVGPRTVRPEPRRGIP